MLLSCIFSFLCPCIDRWGHIVFGLSVCLSHSLSVSLLVHKNIYISHIFQLVRFRTFIFHVSIPCLVPSSRSSAKIKLEYQNHNFQKIPVAGAFMFHEHILFHMFPSLSKPETSISNELMGLYGLSTA